MQKRGIVAFPHDAAKSGHQLRSCRTQFVVMMQRQFAEDLLAFRSEREQDLAAIVASPRAMDKSPSFQPVHQLHRAVVADLHAVGQFANPRAHFSRHALDRQHKLILATLQSCLLYHLLAEVEEAADLVTELRQRLVIRQS